VLSLAEKDVGVLPQSGHHRLSSFVKHSWRKFLFFLPSGRVRLRKVLRASPLTSFCVHLGEMIRLMKNLQKSN
jgi:hypothetical protein